MPYTYKLSALMSHGSVFLFFKCKTIIVEHFQGYNLNT